MTIREVAALWDITERRVSELCKAGRIPGAIKQGRQWIIPNDTDKPLDSRRRSSESASPRVRKPLPIGVSDYREACTGYYYVDKTMLIKEFLDERPKVSLFTRPRRFGKTLNMDMLRVFFEKTGEDTSVYFRDKKIWACGSEYRKHQGRYPVIYVTFKDVKSESWEETYGQICKLLRNEFERHSELLTSSRLSEYEKASLAKYLDGTADRADMAMAFENLSRMLHAHHNVAPIIIIDEYDIPIHHGHIRGFNEQATSFMCNLFSGGLKDNPHISYGFLTGILRVAKGSIFSGLNNLVVNSILDEKYSQYFGFTADEVRQMARYYGSSEKYQEICQWYDGYRFGSTDIFNPWSVIGYFGNDCRPKAFWLSTGSNDIIKEVLACATPDILERLELLMQGKSFLTYIDTDVIYPRLQSDPSSIYSFLLVTGYLKVHDMDPNFLGGYTGRVSLPNKEISFVYSKEILSQLESIIPCAAAIGIQEAIYKLDTDELRQKLEAFLLQTISFHDAASEAFYHGLILGLCAMLDDRYRITSNREAGLGRYDIQMQPLNRKLPGILIELKAGKDCSESQLEELARTALQQINDRNYAVELHTLGVQTVLKYGIAFCGKNVRICAETE